MWVSSGPIRYRKIWIENGILKADDSYDTLLLLDHPDLPSEFAKVVDPYTANKFELNYAPLGYDDLVIYPLERKGGDPVEWVLEQARLVRDTLELIHALAKEDERTALKFFHKYVKHESNINTSKATGGMNFLSGAYRQYMYGEVPSTEEDALWFARDMITMLVNKNTEHVRQELELYNESQIRKIQIYLVLIEAIWSMVGELVFRAQLDEERPYFKKCGLCDTPFYAKDRRQRYCPPIKGRQSHCGNIARQHKFQAKKSQRNENVRTPDTNIDFTLLS
ncbi:hypothetical protein ACFLWI_03300 [Chloroflexota bacterium]